MGEKEPKVTRMILTADLVCPKCYKKVKKVLCKFPQIRDQVFDEKQNKVTINVVCYNPEKLRDKLCRKGCRSIKNIEIVGVDKKKTDEKPKPDSGGKQQKPDSGGKQHKPASDGPPPTGAPRTCCRECSDGVSGGPCYHSCGVKIIQCGGYCGRPVHDSCGCACGCSRGCSSGCHVRSCKCINEENPCGCSRGCDTRPCKCIKEENPCSCSRGCSRGCYVRPCECIDEENPWACTVM